MAVLPPAFTGWYRSNYPTLVFNQDWLEGCVEYLQGNDPAATTTQGLIKAVEVQLLSSDLSTSVVPSPAQRAALTTVYLARDKAILFKGGARKAGVLVQLVETEDIAHSAGQNYEVLKEKREYRRVLSRGGNAGDGGRIMDLADEEQDEDEMKKAILQGGKEPVFQRGSGKMKLSDGETDFTAFELKRIIGLGSEEVKLGTKLLLHDVSSVNGILMLTPQNTTVKGYQVEELEQVAEWQLEKGFRRRLQMDPLPHPGLDDAAAPEGGDEPEPKVDNDEDVDMKPPPLARQARRAPSPPREPVASTSRAKPSSSSSATLQSKPKQPTSEDYGDDFDYDAIAGAFEAGGVDEDEEEAMRAMEADFGSPPPARRPAPPAPQRRTPPLSQPKPTPTLRAVKPEPSSSASSRPQRTALSGTVEVLELDSSSDDEVSAAKENNRPPIAPPKKKAKVAPARVTEEPLSQSKPESGGRVVQKVVLELDDSD